MDRTSKSTQVAIGGVFSALCLIVMFMTGIIPFGTYAFPAIAGGMLAIVLAENGTGVALMIYASVSLLSFFIVPDREAAILFVFFFGYYPVAKVYIEKIPLKLIQYILKFALFNAAVILSYFLMMTIFGMPNILKEFEGVWKYTIYLMLAAGNLVFIAYDFMISRYVLWYKYKIRNKLIK